MIFPMARVACAVILLAARLLHAENRFHVDQTPLRAAEPGTAHSHNQEIRRHRFCHIVAGADDLGSKGCLSYIRGSAVVSIALPTSPFPDARLALS
jgi:hypothetical protein